MKNLIIGILSSIALNLFLIGCSGTSASGTLRVHLTDAPSCGYEHVYVTVDHIEISESGSSWTTIPVDSSVAQPIDLLALTNGVMLTLGELPLKAGTYQQVRLVLAENTGNGPTYANSVVLEGETEQRPLTTPSAQQSGYKILGPITVEAGTLADLVLDFNACKSIVTAGNSGKIILKPVVTATAQVVSGTISGYALAGSEVSAYLQPEGTYLTGTIVADGSATGRFNLGPIIATDATTKIDVVIVPPPSAEQGTIIVQGVPVVASTTTWISTSDAPFDDPDSRHSDIYSVSGVVTIDGTLGAARVAASQTVTSSTRTYEITRGTSSSLTGAYSLSVAASGPWVGSYSATLPITLEADSDVAGHYSMTAESELSVASPVSVDVTAGALVDVDFALTE